MVRPAATEVARPMKGQLERKFQTMVYLERMVDSTVAGVVGRWEDLRGKLFADEFDELGELREPRRSWSIIRVDEDGGLVTENEIWPENIAIDSVL